MTQIAGVDGCPAGWIAITYDVNSRAISSVVAAHFDALARADFAVLAIDIPIGLTDSGARMCDVMARRQLGPRSSSVFPAPIRSAITAANYAEACAISMRAQGRSISKQAFAIYPKIAEVDRALRSDPALQERVYEVHPEVCFQSWNGGVPMAAPKKTSDGKAQRLELVSGTFGPEAFEAVRSSYRRTQASDDDILDAFAALWTGLRIHRGEARSIPPQPPRDSAGLPMVMIY